MKRTKLGMAMIGVLLSFFLISGGIAKAEDGVTDNEILIGSTMDLSGPVAFMGQAFRDGALLYFKHINDQGGIHGRKIKFLVEDDGFQSPRTVLAAKKLITKDKVFCMSMNLGAGGILAIMPLLEEYKVPLLPAGTSNEQLTIPPRKYIFLADTSFRYQGIVAVKYTKETLKALNPKVAIVYQDDVSGSQWLAGIKEGYTKYYGIKDVLELSYKRGAMDFSSQIAKCKQAGVTHVYMHTNIREPAALLKEAQRVQYKAVFFANASSNFKQVVQLAGDAVDYTNGLYMSSYSRDIHQEDTPGFKLYRELVKKYNMGSLDNQGNQWAFSASIILCEVLQRAGKNLTREGFIKAAETMTDYDNGMTVPVTWRSDKRGGGDAVRIFIAENGNWVPKTGWILQ